MVERPCMEGVEEAVEEGVEAGEREVCRERVEMAEEDTVASMEWVLVGEGVVV